MSLRRRNIFKPGIPRKSPADHFLIYFKRFVTRPSGGTVRMPLRLLVRSMTILERFITIHCFAPDQIRGHFRIEGSSGKFASCSENS